MRFISRAAPAAVVALPPRRGIDASDLILLLFGVVAAVLAAAYELGLQISAL